MKISVFCLLKIDYFHIWNGITSNWQPSEKSVSPNKSNSIYVYDPVKGARVTWMGIFQINGALLIWFKSIVRCVSMFIWITETSLIEQIKAIGICAFKRKRFLNFFTPRIATYRITSFQMGFSRFFFS